MRMDNPFVFVALCLLVVWSGNVYADIIFLKSGQNVFGKIIEETADYVKIEIAGVPVTYFSDEIEKIEKDAVFPQSESTDTSQYESAIDNYIADVKYYIVNRQYANALNLSSKIANLYPDESIGYGLMGLSYYYMGKLNEAKQAIERAISISPDCPEYYIIAGVICDDLGLRNASRNNLEMASALLEKMDKRLYITLIVEALLKKIEKL